MEINNVLMVDDDPSIRRIGQLSLQKVGQWNVSLAAGGAEALERLSNESPDVILLDVMMPQMDGPALLEKIRQRPETQKTPVIFMTAKIQNHELQRYLMMDAAGVIGKPFDPITLPQEIRAIVDKAI